MKNQKHSSKRRPVQQTHSSSPKHLQEQPKEPSVLDKLKDQIRKIKELKERRPGNLGDDIP